MPHMKKPKYYSQLRDRFYWFIEIPDRELTEEERNLPEPVLIHRDFNYRKGYGELYLLSDKQYLHRKTEETGKMMYLLIGVELVFDDYLHKEYIYKLPIYENDFFHFVDLWDYYNVHLPYIRRQNKNKKQKK